MSSEDDGDQAWLVIGGGVLGGGVLTLSERQAVAGLEAAAEQDEGLRGGRVGEVDHLQAALQRQLVAQVEQVLLLHGDARLSRHLLKEAGHPGRMETRKSQNLPCLRLRREDARWLIKKTTAVSGGMRVCGCVCV